VVKKVELASPLAPLAGRGDKGMLRVMGIACSAWSEVFASGEIRRDIVTPRPACGERGGGEGFC